MNSVEFSFQIVSPTDLTFATATKTKSIKAKPLVNLMADNTILAKFLLATLEGNQVLKANSMVCIGVDNDVWQQAPATLLKKYTVTDYDEQGWATCLPKPDNEVLAAQVPDYLCDEARFSIFGKYGEERLIDGKQRFLLHGKAGDYVCQSKTDPTDCWIVAKRLFVSTYDWK